MIETDDENNSVKEVLDSDKPSYNYPDLENLELIILKLSPCSVSDILRDRKIQVSGNTITTLQKRVVMLESNGKVLIKRYNKLWVIYSRVIDEFKQKEMRKKLDSMGFNDKGGREP